MKDVDAVKLMKSIRNPRIRSLIFNAGLARVPHKLVVYCAVNSNYSNRINIVSFV